MLIEYQHVFEFEENGRLRTYQGARRLALSTGEAVRQIDANSFEVVATGELLRRDG